MKTEFEATFINIDKNLLRDKLTKIGAKLVKPEALHKRVVFNLPSDNKIPGGWLRVRDEGDKITMSLKSMQPQSDDEQAKIEQQKEIQLKIDDFEQAKEMMELIGCRAKAYQENLRELWVLGEVEITIDTWPFLDPYIEIEANDEETVKNVAAQLGFDYKLAIFDSADYIYSLKYPIKRESVWEDNPKLTFDLPKNPFLKN